MGRQTQRQITYLLGRFPAVGVMLHRDRSGDRSSRNGVPFEIDIRVQKADTEIMHEELRNVGFFRGGYLESEGSEGRATRHLQVYAVGSDQSILGHAYGSDIDPILTAKDVFADILEDDDPEYFFIVTTYHWYHALSEAEQEEQGCYFDRTRHLATEYNVRIYLRPKGMSFKELVQKANIEKEERENAWQYDPKVTPPLPGIDQALKSGCRLHSFRSGGGLRVVRLEKGKELVGYGEAPHVEDALQHASDDYLAGKRPAGEVYGKLYPHYLTGAAIATSNVDCWINRGNTLTGWAEDGVLVCQLEGYGDPEYPEEITNKVITEKVDVLWESRGFTYRISPSQFASGEWGTSATVVAGLDQGKKNPFTYKITKTGEGVDFWQACANAFGAPEVEEEYE